MDQPQSPAAAPAIEMQDVTVGTLSDLEVTVLEGVNWTVHPGEYWVVAGLQDSGMSDLLAMTAGLMPPQKGEYRQFGRDMPMVGEELRPERLRVGLVFEGGQLLHQLTVRQNVALPLLYHRKLKPQEAEARVAGMLEWAGLTPEADLTPGKLARNVQKRAGLARALMLEPEVLLLDNPLGGLDPRQTHWWLNALGELATGGGPGPGRPRTVVASAEYLRPWRERARHFAILRERHFVVLGGRGELAAHPEPLVRELLAEQPV